jgi:hypothetical protein
MGKSKAQKQQEQIVQQQMDLAKQGQAQATNIYNTLAPFGQSLVGAGQQSAQGQPPPYFLNSILPSIGSGFQQARQNLVDFLGKSGQGTESGIGAGPFANLQGEEANAHTDALTQAIMQGLNLGFQGSNVLSGQQSFFDPGRFLGGAGYSNTPLVQMPSFGKSILGGLIGAGIKAIPFGNIFNKIPGMGAPSGQTTST